MTRFEPLQCLERIVKRNKIGAPLLGDVGRLRERDSQRIAAAFDPMLSASEFDQDVPHD